MNVVFEQHFQDLAEEAISVFRTFRKEDIIEDVLDPEYNLISEAFDDVDTLLNYSNSIKSHGNLTMEQCGFIASHINSIERKYKGVIDFNTVVSESQDNNYRSILVAEAMGKGAMVLIAAAIAAVLGIIAWILGKGKQTTKTNAEIVSETIKQNQSKLDDWKEEFKQDAKDSNETYEEQKKKAEEEYQKSLKALEEAEAAEENIKKKNLLIEEKELLKQSKKDYDERFKYQGDQNIFDFDLKSRFLTLYLPDDEYKVVEYKDIESAIKNFEKQNELVLDLMKSLVFSAENSSLGLGNVWVTDKVEKYEYPGIIREFNSLNNILKELSETTPKQHKMVFGLNIDTELVYKNEILLGIKVNSTPNKEPKKTKASFKINVISKDNCIELNSMCTRFSTSKTLPYSSLSLKSYEETLESVKKFSLRTEKRLKDFEKNGKFEGIDEENSKLLVPMVKENIRIMYQCIAVAENIRKRFDFSLVALTKLVNDLIQNSKSSKTKKVNFYSSARASSYILDLRKNK